jgi:hypothetical protein
MHVGDNPSTEGEYIIPHITELDYTAVQQTYPGHSPFQRRMIKFGFVAYLGFHRLIHEKSDF